MTTNQKIRLTMLLAIRNFGNNYEAIAKKISKFWDSFQELLKIIAEIQMIGELQGKNKTGLAMDKNKLKKKLGALAVKYSKKLAILAKLNNNDTLLREITLNESQIERMSEVTLKDRVQTIYDKVEANIASLGEQGLTPETQKIFLETLNAFNNALATPRSGITERSAATKRLQVLFDNAENVIDIMDLAAGSAKDEYPDFYNNYRSSRKLVDTSSGKLALKASARESKNMEPLQGAVFTFKHTAAMASGGNGNGNGSGNGEIVKKTSKKGNFHVKNMEPGTYKVLVSKKGYKEAEVSVEVTDGERSELVVELEKA